MSKSQTTVLIRPVFSPATPFPQPLHVLSYAYDEILKQHLKGHQLAAQPDGLPLPPISVYGKGLGGTLAAAFALTECRALNKFGGFVDSVMTRDAIYDYSPLANEYLLNYVTKKPEKEVFSMHDYLSPDSDLAFASPPSNDFISGPSVSTPAEDIAASDIKTREDLVKSLPHLFSRPEVAFDPFISPLLFFRGRSHDIPTSWTWNGPPGRGSDISLAEHERSRSYVKFPPSGSELRIPWARLCVTSTEEKVAKKSKRKSATKRSAKKMVELTAVYGDNVKPTQDGKRELQSLYAEQANLMAAGMRRGIAKNEDPHLVFTMADYDAEERVRVVHVPDMADEQEKDEMDGVAMQEWRSEIPAWW